MNAIIEAASHENCCEDADHQPPSSNDLTYDQRENVTLAEAIAWANEEPSPVTLYLYDKGAGTT